MCVLVCLEIINYHCPAARALNVVPSINSCCKAMVIVNPQFTPGNLYDLKFQLYYCTLHYSICW
jgi:hypothetical protein